jgi:hypothetical protein
MCNGQPVALFSYWQLMAENTLANGHNQSKQIEKRNRRKHKRNIVASWSSIVSIQLVLVWLSVSDWPLATILCKSVCVLCMVWLCSPSLQPHSLSSICPPRLGLMPAWLRLSQPLLYLFLGWPSRPQCCSDIVRAVLVHSAAHLSTWWQCGGCNQLAGYAAG